MIIEIGTKVSIKPDASMFNVEILMLISQATRHPIPKTVIIFTVTAVGTSSPTYTNIAV
jgi:hypothetical protein